MKKNRMSFRERLANTGPAALITGGTVGPGTVTTATIAGVYFGFSFLWVIIVMTIFKLVSVDMTSRLTLASGKTYQEVLREDVENPVLRQALLIIMLISIVITSLAFMLGNLTGAGLGMQLFLPTSNVGPLAMIVGLVSIALILSGNYKLIEKVIKYLVLLFTLSFILTAIITRPNLIELLKGFLIPRVPEGGWSNLVSLLGTSGLAGYGLFLHTNAIKEKWQGIENLDKARNDNLLLTPVAMFTTAMIIISAASMYGSGIDVNSAEVMGLQMEPLFGPAAKYIFGLGLFSAGISSVIPLTMACTWVITGLTGMDSDVRKMPFKVTATIFLGLATLMAFFAARPVELIVAMQMVNAFLGPISLGVLLVLTNKKSIMKEHTNSLFVNAIGVMTVLFLVYTSARSLINM